MSEPRSVAKRVEEVVPGVLHWTVHDERIDARSDAYAVKVGDSTVLIDPLPLEEKALSQLGKVSAICLTIQSHQRSAWRYRKRFGVSVHAPKGAQGLEQTPDAWYGAGDLLPGGLRAIHAPGPTEASYFLLLEKPNKAGVLFCGDVLVREGNGPFGFVPDEYMDAPRQARQSAHKLLELSFETLCSGHGAPAPNGAVAAVRRALELDRGRQPKT